MNNTRGAVIVILLVLVSGCSLFIPMEKPAESGGKLVLWMPEASSVQVLADWNDWGGYVSAGGILNPLSGNMEKDDTGFWTIDISGLSGGVYRYVFLVNGYRWIRDPVNPETAVFEDRTVSTIMIRN